MIHTQKPRPSINKNNRNKFISMRQISTINLKTITQQYNLSHHTRTLLNLLMVNLS